MRKGDKRARQSFIKETKKKGKPLSFINDNLNMYINDHLRMYTSDYALI